jgi:hypothetical protein
LLAFSDNLAVTFLTSLLLSIEDDVIKGGDSIGLVFEFQARIYLI